MKVLTVILAFIWFLGWGFWFLYERGHIHFSSDETNITSEEPREDTIKTVSVTKRNSSFLLEPLPKDAVDMIIDSLMADRKSGEAIQVISYYSEEEPYNGEYANLGIQRSNELISNARKRYAGRVLQPIGLLLKEEIDTAGISNYYQVMKTDKMNPIQLVNDHRILVFFPYAYDNEEAAAKISKPLDSLSSIWNQESNRLIVTGYTDNATDETTNYNLGLERAKFIQEQIIFFGIAEDRITTLSRGEKEPISINSSFEGRYLNRRVEILVDK